MKITVLRAILQDLEDKGYGDYNVNITLSENKTELIEKSVDLINKQVNMQ